MRDESSDRRVQELTTNRSLMAAEEGARGRSPTSGDKALLASSKWRGWGVSFPWRGSSEGGGQGVVSGRPMAPTSTSPIDGPMKTIRCHPITILLGTKPNPRLGSVVPRLRVEGWRSAKLQSWVGFVLIFRRRDGRASSRKITTSWVVATQDVFPHRRHPFPSTPTSRCESGLINLFDSEALGASSPPSSKTSINFRYWWQWLNLWKKLDR